MNVGGWSFVYLLTILVAFAAYASPPRPVSAAINCDVADLSVDAEELNFLTLINNYRAANGRQPLKISRTLNRAASWFSVDMAAKDYFPADHVDSLGRSAFTRMDQCDVASGFSRAENIAVGTDADTAAEAFAIWQGSPPHNANMLDLNYRSIGIARAFGTYLSGPGWYWTTDFSSEIVSTGVSDFNGDRRADPGVFRPSGMPNALWYSPPSGGGAAFQIYFGMNGDIPVSGDYDADSRTDAAIWRPSTGLWYGPRTGAAQIVTQFFLGQNGDIPVPCDYDGDGAMDPAIYRPSTGLWYGTNAAGNAVVINVNLGQAAGDIPAPADFNGDGKCDPAILRPGVGPGGTNLWYSVPSGGGAAFQIYFGAVGDIPAPADYDGDGKADAVIFRPSTGLWYGPRTGAAQIVTQMILGQNSDIPVPGDYNGDGATDPAIFRPSTGLFYGTNAAGNTIVLNTNLGVAAGDIPTGQRPHYQAAYPYSINRQPLAGPSPTVVSANRATPTQAAGLSTQLTAVATASNRPLPTATRTPTPMTVVTPAANRTPTR